MRKAMIRKENAGMYIVNPEWEEISPGLYTYASDAEESSAIVSSKQKIRTKEILPGIYEVLE